MRRLFLDIETYSSVDLTKAGVYAYAESDDFEVLMCAYAFDNGEVKILIGEHNIAAALRSALSDKNVLKVAHNAQFERVCLSKMLGMPVGMYLAPHGWEDTAATAAENGYPRSLENAAEALGCTPKDKAGSALIRLFCMPQRNGQKAERGDHTEKWKDFIAYCIQDVATLREIWAMCDGWPSDTERDIWCADQVVNDRGFKIDVGLATAAAAAAEENNEEAMAELRDITGLDNPNSVIQFKRWVEEAHGIAMKDMAAKTVTALLAQDGIDTALRRALELRQGTALAASKKFATGLLRMSSDGRLRGSFQFFGAHTGRWAGRGLQPQNLPRATIGLTPKQAALVAKEGEANGKDAAEVMATQYKELNTEEAVVDLKLGLGADPETLKALVRGCFAGPLTVVDYSSIEARVVAWLAGEEWALQAFRDGRDIYVETASRMGPQYGRSQGKVAVLALGYNGAVNSLRAMGATGSDEELARIVSNWRKTNSKIVDLWADLEYAFLRGGEAGDKLRVEVQGDDRLLWLPSGRPICYRDVKAKERFRFEDKETGRWQQKIAIGFASSKGKRDFTYGGRLVENVTQAVARDILGQALINLVRAGVDVHGHVHDEVIVGGRQDLDMVRELMLDMPAWAEGLPLGAEGYTCSRYRKG